MGYSRAVRAGSIIYVSGTTATNSEGKIVGRGDPYRQAVQTIKNIETALHHFGCGFENVVRTRIYVTDISQWKEIARAHAQFFADIRPATSMLEISRFISDEILVEIEAEAIVDQV